MRNVKKSIYILLKFTLSCLSSGNIYYIFGQVQRVIFVSVNFLVMFKFLGHIHSGKWLFLININLTSDWFSPSGGIAFCLIDLFHNILTVRQTNWDNCWPKIKLSFHLENCHIVGQQVTFETWKERESSVWFWSHSFKLRQITRPRLAIQKKYSIFCHYSVSNSRTNSGPIFDSTSNQIFVF